MIFFFRFIFVHAGSSLMREDFSPIAASGEYCPVVMRRLFLHCSGFSCCEARAVAHRLQQWWRGLVAPEHVGSSWIRDQTSVSCIGGQVLSSPTEPSGKPLKLIQRYMSTICQQKAKETNKQTKTIKKNSFKLSTLFGYCPLFLFQEKHL